MIDISSFSSHIIYLLTFLIIGTETGIVFCFFLPGDTLLFTLGLLSRSGVVALPHSIATVFLAGFIGNLLGYSIGRYFLSKKNSFNFLKRVPDSHIKKTENFFQKYGSATIVLSRFVPVVRTIAPFLAGVAKMNKIKFVSLSFFGAILWSVVVICSGYFFGSYIKVSHIGLVGLGLMVLASVVTPIAVFLLNKYKNKN